MTNASPAPAAVQPSDRVGVLDTGYPLWYGVWALKYARPAPGRGARATIAPLPAQPRPRRKTRHVWAVA